MCTRVHAIYKEFVLILQRDLFLFLVFVTLFEDITYSIRIRHLILFIGINLRINYMPDMHEILENKHVFFT